MRLISALLFTNTLFVNAANDLYISEVATKGTSGHCNGEDWIEIYNSGISSTSTSLEGWTLHDENGRNDENSVTFSAQVIIGAGEYRVFCCNSESVDEPNFKVGRDDSLTLLNKIGAVVSATGTLPGANIKGQTYALKNDGTYAYTYSPTFEAANIFTDIAPEALEPDTSSETAVNINEVADKGSKGHCGGEDWVEIINGGDSSISLEGWVLHDDKGRDDESAVTFSADLIIEAKGLHVVCCNSDASDEPKFKISSRDTIVLLDADGAVVSTFGPLPGGGKVGSTYSRKADGTFAVTNTPTFGAVNVFGNDTTTAQDSGVSCAASVQMRRLYNLFLFGVFGLASQQLYLR